MTRKLSIVFAGMLLAASGAFAATNVTHIFCKAELIGASGDGLNYSIELTPTLGYEPATAWLPGQVAYGGTADTWYDSDGPASFAIKNTGTARCDIWICAETAQPYGVDVDWDAIDDEFYLGPIFVGDGNSLLIPGIPSPDPDRIDSNERPDAEYSLAIAVNVTGIAPQWKILSHVLRGEPNTNPGSELAWNTIQQVGMRMSALVRPGDTVPFDLKYFAPLEGPDIPEPVPHLFVAAFYAVPVWPEEDANEAYPYIAEPAFGDNTP